MATYLIGVLVFVVLGFGIRHIIHNFSTGESDCCGSGGSSGCQGGCSHCQTKK